MHAVEFYNCSNCIEGMNGGFPYCPNMLEDQASAIKFMPSSMALGSLKLITRRVV
jgi:hypothetical protein